MADRIDTTVYQRDESMRPTGGHFYNLNGKAFDSFQPDRPHEPHEHVAQTVRTTMSLRPTFQFCPCGAKRPVGRRGQWFDANTRVSQRKSA